MLASNFKVGILEQDIQITLGIEHLCNIIVFPARRVVDVFLPEHLSTYLPQFDLVIIIIIIILQLEWW